MREPYEPAPIVEVLVRHGVRFVLIGGLAGVAWGSPIITHDVDICYDRRPDNLERLVAALHELRTRLRERDLPEELPFKLDAVTIAAGDHFTFATSLGPLDILGTPAGTRGFDELDRTATPIDIGGSTVRVASLDDLIRMKRASGRPKDREAMETLGALRDELEKRERR